VRLVDAFGVEGQVADELSFGGQDANVAVGHQDQDCLSAMPATNPHVVEGAVVAQGPGPGGPGSAVGS
jgi:hypothetical protein